MTPSRHNPILVIAKNIGALTVGTLVGRLLSFVIVAIVARTAGTDGLGGYATANAIAAFTLVLADVGLSSRLLREAAKDPARTSPVYAESIGVKTFISLALCPLLAALFFVLPYEPWVRDLTLLLSFSWLIRSYTQLNHSVIRARERMGLEAVSVIVQSGIFVAVSLACIQLGYSLVSIGWAAVTAALVQLLVSTLIARRFCSLAITMRPEWETVRGAAPYTATLVANAAFAQSNIIVISLVATQSVVGEFSSVFRILLLATIVPQLITLAILPGTARVFGQADPARFRRLTTASLRLLLILAGAGAVILIGISKPIMHFIYGEQLESLYPYLQLGTLYFVFQFASRAMGAALTASGRQNARARAIVIAIVSSIVLFVTLTPLLGVLGAVLALIMAELTLVAAEFVWVRDLLDVRDLVRNVAAVLVGGAAATAGHFWLEAAGHVWPAMVAPVFVYAALLVPSGEPRKMLELLRRRR
jgi:O-antigen/teichoic acid export membrane protein